jgi:ABC-type transporter lipoprotein component MlaA
VSINPGEGQLEINKKCGKSFSLPVEVIWEKMVNRFHFLKAWGFTKNWLKIYNLLNNLLVS